MSRRYALREDQWDRIQGLLPGREGHVGGTARDNAVVCGSGLIPVSRGDSLACFAEPVWGFSGDPYPPHALE